MEENMKILAVGEGSKNHSVYENNEKLTIDIPDPINTRLTDENIDTICEKINEVTKDDEEYKKLRALPSNNGIEEREVTEQVVEEGEEKTYVVNPDTGQYKEEDPIEEEVEYDFTVTKDQIDSYFEKNKVDKIGDWVIKSITKEDIFLVIDYYQKHDNSIKYKVLPPSIRNFIYKIVLNESNGAPIIPEILDITADHFASSLLIEFQTFAMQDSYQKEWNQISVDAMSDLSKLYEDQIFDRKESIEKMIEQADTEEKKESLRNILKAHTESYELNDFIQAIKDHKIKAKKSDMQKPQKVFRDFNYKYEYNENFNIHCGIHHLVSIIQTFANISYTNDEICAMLVLFCKYCWNFKPDNTPEGIMQHSFMSFFISNIYSLRMVAQGAEQTEFQANMITKINELINTVRNSDYKKIY